MKAFTILALGALVAAYPGQEGKKRDHSGVFKALIERAGERLLVERQGPPAEPVTKIGNLQDAGTNGTAVNDQIMNCFNSPNGAACIATDVYTPPTKDTKECAADTCCIWSYIKDDLVPLFLEADGTCNDIARNAVRFGFHDAGAWDAKQTHGGADGSLLLSPDEVSRPENSGLNKGKVALLPVFLKYRRYGISAADLVQFAHNVAVVTCPLGPRSLTFVGRKDWTPAQGENPTGLLPDARSAADINLDLFANKTIGTVDFVSLLGAHTSAKQFFFDTSKSGQPLDSTPGVWDVAFYSEVLAGKAQCGVFRLPSDDSFGNFSSTAPGFNALSGGFPADAGSGQILWNGLYSRAYLRLSLLGVADVQGLTDCSKVLPAPIVAFDKPPSAVVTCPASSSVASSTVAKSSASQSASSVGSLSLSRSVASQSASATSSKVEVLSSKSSSSGDLGLFTATGSAPVYKSTVTARTTCSESTSSKSHASKHHSSGSRTKSEHSKNHKSTSTSCAEYTSWTPVTTTVVKTHTVGQTTSCETQTLTTSSPIVQTISSSTGVLTHTSVITLGSSSYSTSTWTVPVTSLIYPGAPTATAASSAATSAATSSPASYTGAAPALSAWSLSFFATAAAGFFFML